MDLGRRPLFAREISGFAYQAIFYFGLTKSAFMFFSRETFKIPKDCFTAVKKQPHRPFPEMDREGSYFSGT